MIIEPDVAFHGSIVYAKAGNIWVQTATDVHQLTNSGTDSMPAYSDDGQWIYFIRETDGRGRFPAGGGGSRTWYDLSTPALMRVKPDGSGTERLLNGRYQTGGSTWFYWMREPTPDAGREGRPVDLGRAEPAPERHRPQAVRPDDEEARPR